MLLYVVCDTESYNNDPIAYFSSSKNVKEFIINDLGKDEEELYDINVEIYDEKDGIFEFIWAKKAPNFLEEN